MSEATESMQFRMRDLLWWMAMAAFVCGAMAVPVYSASNPLLSRAGFAVPLLITAWRVRWAFHK